GSFVGDMYLKFTAKKVFDDLNKDYETIEGDTYEKQVEAFNYLEDEQNAVAEYAKKHATAYKIYTAAYGAATAVALVELSVGTATGSPAPCVMGDGSQDDKVKEEQQKLKMNRLSLIKNTLMLNHSGKKAVSKEIN